MKIFAPLFALVVLIASVQGACSGPNARIHPPADAIVVDATGAYSGSVRTVADGVAKLPNTTAEHTLFVFPGVYEEQKDIDPTIYQHRNDLTTTLRLRTDDVKVYNLNVANMAGKIEKGGQALAVSVVGTNSGFYACNFMGYQDTLYANKGANLYAKSYISGAIDFIFGQVANAWFDFCDIVAVDAGHITANGRNSDTNPSTFVFNNARVFGSAAPGTVYLGRPWQPYARVIFQNSELSDVINPAGWELWEDNNTANVYFREYNNSGVGAATEKRVDFSGLLAKPLAIADVLGEKFKKNRN